MKIKEILWQHRNDFDAIIECEHCGHEHKLQNGYNDAYYHTRVLPSITCGECKKDRAGNITDQNENGTKNV